MGEGDQPVVTEAEKVSVAKIKEKRERNRPPTKIICRRLPPTMTEESFLEQVSPVPEHDYFYYSKPDMSLAPNLFCRAYINFVSVEDIYIFRDKFDDYIFLDDKGVEYPAIVEYSPFQRMPKKRRKKDIKSGMIESDPTYLEFLESLKETDSDSREPKMEYSYQLNDDVEKKEPTTPLLDFLAARKRDDKRRREERQKRRPRNRNSKDDDYEEDPKNIKSSENDIDNTIDNEDELADNEVEIKEIHFQAKGRSKLYKDQKRSAEDHRKKSDYGKNESYDDDKSSKRDRQRESYKERNKERFGEKKDKLKFLDKKMSKIDEQDKGFKKPSEISTGSEIKSAPITIASKSTDKVAKVSKNILVSSKIKPFTTLPQLNVSELSKVIDELDNNSKKEKISSSRETSEEKVVVKNMDDVKSKPTETQQRRNSLESNEKPKGSDSPLKKQKSLDDKSQTDTSEHSERHRDDPRTERRIRNKDRPSLAIYKPGMGKFSKQRLEREKDTKCTDKGGQSLHSSSNSINSQE